MQDAKSQFIAGTWYTGKGEPLSAINPATNQIIWQGSMANQEQSDLAISTARQAFNTWSQLDFKQRYAYLEKFVEILAKKQSELSESLSQDMGKPLWEAKTEIVAMINKLDISKQAYLERCKQIDLEQQGINILTRHKPHGVVLVLGPFNFPGHLPNGHILPALLAGNTVVFKPSELTPYFSIKVMECWEAAKLPNGVINMVQGDGRVGAWLLENSDLDGIFFTGSFSTGQKIATKSLEFPRRIVALEMGGNNPLVVFNPGNIDAAVYDTLHSAYVTSGQRCSCARRLIVLDNEIGRSYVQRLVQAISKLKVGAYNDESEPFMGPLISNAAVEHALTQYAKLCAAGAKILAAMGRIKESLPFLTPGLLDVTDIKDNFDEEIFAPLLQLYWVSDLEQALKIANHSEYGLAAGIFTQDAKVYQQFYQNVKAGIINWNRPLTGASSACPFGGIGKSGNYRPSAYYAADYCAYPVASSEQLVAQIPDKLSPGITL